MGLKYLHFCGGFGAAAGKPLRFWELLAIKSAQRLHPNATVMLHTIKGSWSNASDGVTVKHYTEQECRQYTTWKCKHGAHQSDKVRLMALLEYGGLYQDTDSFMLKNCDDLASLSTAAMPLQNRVSLANGFMYSPAPGNPWLTEAQNRVDTLGSAKGWDGSSIRLYTKLYKERPQGCTALPCSDYLVSSTQPKDKDFFFGLMTKESLLRLEQGKVVHALEPNMNHAFKKQLMDNPPKFSLYAHVLELISDN